MTAFRHNSPPSLGFVTIETLAQQLEISPRTIRRWVQHGQLPLPRRLGRSAFWSVDSIREALIQREGGKL